MSLGSLLGAGIGMLTGMGPVGQGIGAALGSVLSGDDPKKAILKGLTFGGLGAMMPGMAGMFAGKTGADTGQTTEGGSGGFGGIGKFLTSPGGAMIAAGVLEQLLKEKEKAPTREELTGERSEYGGELMIPENLKTPVGKEDWLSTWKGKTGGNPGIPRTEGGLIEGPGSVTSDDIPGVIVQNGSPVEQIRVSNEEVVLSGKDLAGLDPNGDWRKAGAELGSAPNGTRGAKAAEMYRRMMA